MKSDSSNKQIVTEWEENFQFDDLDFCNTNEQDVHISTFEQQRNDLCSLILKGELIGFFFFKYFSLNTSKCSVKKNKFPRLLKFVIDSLNIFQVRILSPKPKCIMQKLNETH